MGFQMDPLLKLIAAAVLGLVSKIIFDWLSSGKVSKGGVMTPKQCEELRAHCCVPQLKKDIGVLKAGYLEHEKRLKEGRQDFRAMRDDISKISSGIAGIREVLDIYVKRRENPRDD